MNYVVSDIHGEYDEFVAILGKMNFGSDDKLYVLGDVLDRGAYPIRTLKLLMGMENVVPIMGNHEVMALRCLENADRNLEELTDDEIYDLILWTGNGADTTLKEFYGLSDDEKKEVVEYLETFSDYAKVEAGGQKYLLVHGGLMNFDPYRPLVDYTLDELVWERPDYGRQYFEDVITITGHTPTQLIEENPRPGYIFKKNNHWAIDCGACFGAGLKEGGRLAAVCLETGEELYAE